MATTSDSRRRGSFECTAQTVIPEGEWKKLRCQAIATIANVELLHNDHLKPLPMAEASEKKTGGKRCIGKLCKR